MLIHKTNLLSAHKSIPNSQIDFALDMNYSATILETDGPERDMVKSQIQQDFAKADIYFQSLNVQTIAQEEKYTVTKYTKFRLYGLFGFFPVIWSMVNHILVLNISDIWSFCLYGQLCQDKTVDHISETWCM